MVPSDVHANPDAKVRSKNPQLIELCKEDHSCCPVSSNELESSKPLRPG